MAKRKTKTASKKTKATVKSRKSERAPSKSVGNAIDRFDLERVVLVESSCSQCAKSSFKISFGVSSDCDIRKQEKAVAVTIHVTVVYDESDDELLACAFQSIMKTNGAFPKLSDEDKKSFVHSGMLHTWPYIRQHISTLTTAMGLPQLVLPFHRVTAAK